MLYECAAFEKWGEEVDENWVGSGAEFCFEGSHNYSKETKRAYA